MRATLFGVPGSHPSLAAQLMLEHKGIDYRRVDLVAGVHRALVRAAGFPRMTVPAIKLEGARFQGTLAIARALDALRPDPPLFPSDPEQRAAVERAESWGDEVLQPVPRRIVWAALKRDGSELETYLEDARLGIPANVAAKTAAPVIVLAAKLNHATDEAVQRDLAALPGLIDRVEELLDAGVIGGDEPNVADFQIATSLRLLMALDDLRPLLGDRPAARYAARIVPHYPGHTAAVLPREWLPPTRFARRAAAASS
jgi:glutathione S-transferase